MNKLGNLSEEEMTQYNSNNVGYDASEFGVVNYSLQLDGENNDSNNEYSNNDSILKDINGNLDFVSEKIMDNEIDTNLEINSNDNLTDTKKNNILVLH